MRRDNLTSSGPISFTLSICCFGHSSKYFCIITSYMTAFPNRRIHLRKQRPHLLCYFCTKCIICENYYYQWLLLLFLVIFSVSLSGSDDFVLFDWLDWNAKFMRDSSFVHKFNTNLWKHSVIFCHIWIYKHKSICSLSYRCTTFKTPDSFNLILKHRINLISCQIFLRLVRIWIDVCLSPKVAEGTA